MTIVNAEKQSASISTLDDFHDCLTAGFPSLILIDIAEVCNLASTHCPLPDFKKSEHYGRSYADLVPEFINGA